MTTKPTEERARAASLTDSFYNVMLFYVVLVKDPPSQTYGLFKSMLFYKDLVKDPHTQTSSFYKVMMLNLVLAEGPPSLTDSLSKATLFYEDLVKTRRRPVASTRPRCCRYPFESAHWTVFPSLAARLRSSGGQSRARNDTLHSLLW